MAINLSQMRIHPGQDIVWRVLTVQTRNEYPAIKAVACSEANRSVDRGEARRSRPRFHGEPAAGGGRGRGR